MTLMPVCLPGWLVPSICTYRDKLVHIAWFRSWSENTSCCAEGSATRKERGHLHTAGGPEPPQPPKHSPRQHWEQPDLCLVGALTRARWKP